MDSLTKLAVEYILIDELKVSEYNPRKHTKKVREQLAQSITRFGMVDPIIANSAAKRKNVVIGGHFRLSVAKELKYTEVPVVYVNIPDLEREKELNIRLNKNVGEFDLELLAEFDENFLADLGFSSIELDEVFKEDSEPEQFNLKKALAKAGVTEVKVKPGQIYQLGDNRLMCGNSTSEEDVLKLMDGAKIDMCFTDPPYILDYLSRSKRSGGFGAKKNRRYIGTDELPDNFTELWMSNVHKVQKENFSIICYENWKNIMTIWQEMLKYWKVKNMIVWHLPNRTQGYSAKHKFFSKHDIAMVASTEDEVVLNTEDEVKPFQEEYETALFAISGDPHWEGYKKGKKYAPTDFIEYKASDEKSSGQGGVFGTKPIEILIPYIKVLTKRNDLIFEPFGGSGSTLIAAHKMDRRCYVMEKAPEYAEVIKARWETLSGQKATLIYDPSKEKTNSQKGKTNGNRTKNQKTKEKAS